MSPSTRPETPLYKSRADGKPLIHAPQPKKSIPMLERRSPVLEHVPTVHQTPPSTIDTATPKPAKAARVTSPYVRNRNNLALHSPAAYLHGTKDKCVRHGRKRELMATNDKQEKGRTGAYHPTGSTVRQQVEATSPWSIPSLTSKQGIADVCPDCKAELGIKRREAMQTVMRPADILPGVAHQASKAMSQVVSPLAKPVSRQRDDTQQARATREASTNASHDDLVITEDLGDGLDAAIFERGGELECVIVNTRLGRPVMDTMQKLSKDLLSLSHALAFVGAGSPVTAAVHTTQERAVVFDTPGSKGRRKCSVSELLDLVDKAVDSMHGSRPSHGASEDGDAETSGTTRLVHSETFRDGTELQKAGTDHEELERAVVSAATKSAPQPAKTDRKLDTSHAAETAVPTITTTNPRLMDSAASTMTSAVTSVAQAAQQALPLPPIASNPNPYHHAPDTPRNLNVAQWADKEVQRAQQVMRNAMRQQKEAAIAQAAAVETEVKKQRSVIAKAERALGSGWGLFGGSSSHPSAEH